MKRKIVTLITILMLCAVSGSAAFVFGFGVADRANGNLNAATQAADAYVGEKIKIETGIAFDDDETVLASVEVRNLDTGKLCDVKDLHFTPTEKGEYKISLIKTRNGESVPSYYIITVAYSLSPILSIEPALPYAFVNGSDYYLSELGSYIYAEGAEPTAAATEISVIYNGKTEKLPASRKFVPQVDRSGDTVLLRYTAKGKDGNNLVKEYEKPVVMLKGADNKLTLQESFVQKSIDSATAERSAVTYNFSAEKARLEFCNVIPVSNFRLRWAMVESRANFDEMTVILTDYKNSAQSVELRFSENKAANNTYLRINSGASYIAKNVFKSGSFDIKYGISKREVVVGESSVAVVNDTVSGEAFTGFTSGLIKIAIEFRKVRGYSAVAISQVGNQPINSVASDSVSPDVFFPDEVSVRYGLGDTVKIGRAIPYDILDPAPKVTLTVYKLEEDGSAINDPVYDINGNELTNCNVDEDIYFTATEICSYRLEYIAVDWNNRKATKSFIYYITDNEPPVATFGAMPTTATVGSSVNLPSISVTDNNGAHKVLVHISYLTPANVIEVVKDGAKSIKVTQKGVYTIRYFIYDAYYNYVTKEFKVEVS